MQNAADNLAGLIAPLTWTTSAGRLARSGARVAVNDLPGAALARAVAELRSEGCAVEAASARQVAASALDVLGGLDYLVNDAGALRSSRGAVVNTVSVAAFGGGASSTAYATAKAGLAGLTRELARGLAPAVRVNGIAPGLVNSNWECSFGDIAAAARAVVPLARVGEPDDDAEVIVFLCAGAYITGEVIPVTGGSRL
ncbi:MAG TPA: SDR family oxidoreductase [Steroidobacteraceae bacterium]|nr:SDR family oxidoreductase [Steroidobacteraceae bacterium]